MEWDVSALVGPEGADWRVPPNELANRLELVEIALLDAGIESMLVHDPVDLYWLTGGRQNGMLVQKNPQLILFFGYAKVLTEQFGRLVVQKHRLSCPRSRVSKISMMN